MTGVTYPNCQHCNEQEDIQHYFEICQQYDTECERVATAKKWTLYNAKLATRWITQYAQINNKIH